MQAGVSYAFRIRAIDVANSSVLSVVNAPLDAYSNDTLNPGKHSKPRLVVIDHTAANTTDHSFRLNVSPVLNDQTIPSFVDVTFSYLDDTGVTQSDESIVPVTLSNNTVFLVDVTPGQKTDPANTQYFNIQARVGDQRASTDPSWSAFTTVSPSNDTAWTLPTVPSSDYLNVTEGPGSITATVNFPATNSLNTQYQIQLVQNPADFLTNNPLDPIIPSNIVTVGHTPNAITGLTPQTAYFIRTYVFGNPAVKPTFDVWTAGSQVTTNSPSVTGTVVPTSTGSLKAQWNLSTFTGVGTLLAGTTDQSGLPVPTAVSDQLTGPFVNGVVIAPINVQSLPISNAIYTLTLEDIPTAGGNPIPYAGSQLAGATLASTPTVPTANLGGTVTGGIQIFIGLPAPAQGTQNSDGNASDSKYAIQVSSNGQPPQWLVGSGNLTGQPQWFTLTQWQTTSTTTLNNAGLANNFNIAVAVQEKSPAAPTPYLLSPAIPESTPGAFISLTSNVSGLPLDNYVFGVSLAGPFKATFSTPMSPAVLNSATLKDLVTGAPVNITTTYGPPSCDPQTLCVSPAVNSPLDPAHPYELDIPSGLLDNFGYACTESLSTQFVTGLDPSQNTTVYSPWDTGKQDGVLVSADALGTGSFLVARPQADLKSPGDYDNAANVRLKDVQNLLGSNNNMVSAGQVEVLVFTNNPSGPPTQANASPSPVTLTMTMGTGAQAMAVDPSTLGIYYVNTSNGTKQLQLMQGSHTVSNGAQAPSITQSGVYVLAGAISTSLSASYAWPVPYKPSAGHTTINFVNLAANSTVRIFTITGALVNTLVDPGNTGTIQWNVKNSDGKNVASGVYIYQIKNSFSEKDGKLIIIR